MTVIGKTTSTYDPYTWEWRAPAERGWECPRCGQVWAPWISQCNCSKNKTNITWTTTTTTSPEISLDDDKWKKTIYCKAGGSDYYDEHTKTWTNVPKTYGNTVKYKIERI